MAGYEAYERTVEVGLVLGIAEALRDEFGVAIDAHPGGEGNEAGVVNRAFRASARRILGTIVPIGEDLDAVVTCVCGMAALRRLAEVGVDGGGPRPCSTRSRGWETPGWRTWRWHRTRSSGI